MATVRTKLTSIGCTEISGCLVMKMFGVNWSGPMEDLMIEEAWWVKELGGEEGLTRDTYTGRVDQRV